MRNQQEYLNSDLNLLSVFRVVLSSFIYFVRFRRSVKLFCSFVVIRRNDILFFNSIFTKFAHFAAKFLNRLGNLYWLINQDQRVFEFIFGDVFVIFSMLGN